MKILMIFLILFSIISCKNEQKEKAKQFKKEFNEITSVNPERVCNDFILRCKNAPSDSPFSKYTPAMINSQCATIYSNQSKKLADFVIEILFYKKEITDKKLSVDDLLIFLEGRNEKSKDDFSDVVSDAFNLIAEYRSNAMKLNLGL